MSDLDEAELLQLRQAMDASLSLSAASGDGEWELAAPLAAAGSEEELSAALRASAAEAAAPQAHDDVLAAVLALSQRAAERDGPDEADDDDDLAAALAASVNELHAHDETLAAALLASQAQEQRDTVMRQAAAAAAYAAPVSATVSAAAAAIGANREASTIAIVDIDDGCSIHGHADAGRAAPLYDSVNDESGSVEEVDAELLAAIEASNRTLSTLSPRGGATGAADTAECYYYDNDADDGELANALEISRISEADRAAETAAASDAFMRNSGLTDENPLRLRWEAEAGPLAPGAFRDFVVVPRDTEGFIVGSRHKHAKLIEEATVRIAGGWCRVSALKPSRGAVADEFGCLVVTADTEAALETACAALFARIEDSFVRDGDAGGTASASSSTPSGGSGPQQLLLTPAFFQGSVASVHAGAHYADGGSSSFVSNTYGGGAADYSDSGSGESNAFSGAGYAADGGGAPLANSYSGAGGPCGRSGSVPAPATISDRISAMSRHRLPPLDPNSESQRHIFVDFSNIFHGARQVGRGGQERDYRIRLDVPKLADLLRTYHTSAAVCVNPFVAASFGGSAIYNQWEEGGFKVKVVAVSDDGREHAVDECLHAQMFQRLVQTKRDPAGVNTMVLVTGDGNDNEGNTNFVEILLEAIEQGWRVEVWSWRACRSHHYDQLRRTLTDRVTLVDLDVFKPDITQIVPLDEARTGHYSSGGGANSGGGGGGGMPHGHGSAGHLSRLQQPHQQHYRAAPARAPPLPNVSSASDFPQLRQPYRAAVSATRGGGASGWPALQLSAQPFERQLRKGQRRRAGGGSAAEAVDSTDGWEAFSEAEPTAEDVNCMLCVRNRRNVRLRACGHIVLCGGCASRAKECPLCNKPNGGVLPVSM